MFVGAGGWCLLQILANAQTQNELVWTANGSNRQVIFQVNTKFGAIELEQNTAVTALAILDAHKNWQNWIDVTWACAIFIRTMVKRQ